MPEHTPDPIHELENFGTGGVTVTPMDAAQVRRLGDRRRNRRRGAVALAASVVVVAAAATPIALLSNHDGGGSGPATQTSAPPAPSESTTAPNPVVVTFPEPGVQITAAADTSKLEGTSEEFKTFIAGVWQADTDAEKGCPTPLVTVKKYSSAGYAIGAVGGCGGYVALWVDRDGQWQEGMGTTDMWDCDTLDYLGVPESFAGKCADESGDFGPAGTGGLNLGMTAAEVEAAGGKVEQGAAGSCSTLVLPYRTRVPDATDGYLAPDEGVVLLSARPGAKTPEKVGLGSTKAKVQQTYPDGHLSNGYWVVPLGQGAEYEFGLGEDATVTEMLLADEGQPCTQ